jgi:hypothetical protein
MEDRIARAPGQYHDILRVVGRVLDERQALMSEEANNNAKSPAPRVSDLEIVEHEVFMAVSWCTTSGSVGRQAYTELNLAECRTSGEFPTPCSINSPVACSGNSPG